MEANTMAHYIDDDIITSHHLLAPKGSMVRSRGNATGLTKRKITAPNSPQPEVEDVSAAASPSTSTVEESAHAQAQAQADIKARREAMRARHMKPSARRRRPKSPFGLKPGKALELGWLNVPLVSRLLVSGVLLVVLALTTPFWAYVQSYTVPHATFGLWHFCIGTECWSIHDNLVSGRDVPLWYMVSQMTFTIGVICATLAMFVVTSNHVGDKVKLSPTTNSTMVMMLVVGVLQMSTALYTFISYFEDVSFMYEYTEEVEVVDFYGSFWLGVIGTGLIFISAMMLFFDEEIMPYPESLMYGYATPPGYFPPGFLPPQGDYVFSPTRKFAYSPPSSPDSYSSFPPDGYLCSPNSSQGEGPPGYALREFPPGYASGEFSPGYSMGDCPGDFVRPGSYPDNALFSDMDRWHNRNWVPIVSQSEVPVAENSVKKLLRPKRSFVEDYVKKST